MTGLDLLFFLCLTPLSGHGKRDQQKNVAELCDVSLAAVGPTWKGFYCNTNGEKHPNRKPTQSADSWMYPGPNVPLWEIPREHNKYRGYTVRGTPNCRLTQMFVIHPPPPPGR